MTAAPFRLLTGVLGDAPMAEIFSADRTILGWLEAEIALAEAQADAGVVSPAAAAAIRAAARLEHIDQPALWRDMRTVGYPILPLVRMIDAALPPELRGRVHYGATTQDIMDTGLALQLAAALDRLELLLERFGSRVAELALEHRGTVLAARTHAQQAVPTTLGAKLAVLLDELSRHRDRIGQLRPRVLCISLFGAGGTSAALGPSASAIRAAMAARLGLRTTAVPWHVARDGIAELGQVCAGLSATCARFGREVVDLSRTEIGELAEPGGHHRGASSTMPQKANPISSEATIGMSAVAGALASALYRAMEAGHERAAGEWQVEWEVIPQLAVLAAGGLGHAGDVAAGLEVFPETMRRNLEHGDGHVMAEAYMMRLAGELGRERAHDLVYAAVRAARERRIPLERAVGELAGGVAPISPDDYLGTVDAAIDAAVALWNGGAV